MSKIRRYILTGFILVVPVFLTVFVLVTLFQFVDGILGRFLNVLLERTVGFYIPGLGILLSVLFIFLVGFVATVFLGRNILQRLERWFSHLPLIDKIYPTMKQVVSFMMAQKEFGFKKVVLVEYPSRGIWSLGFLTNEEFKRISEATSIEMASVFVPSSPNPLTGYLIFVPKASLKFLDLSITDAIKTIISGGVVKP